MTEIVRVVVVDDSAYVRKVFKQMLSRSPFIDVVGTARDGAEALEMVAELRPDVVTCDLNMPEMDGLAFVRTQMAIQPVPILIISIASGSGEQVLAALDAGAVDFLQKPTALATDRLLEISEELIEKVKAAAHAAPMRALVNLEAESPVVNEEPRDGATNTSMVVIGASTGGPQALKAVLARLPADCPVPVALVLHMPIGYTEMYAAKLNELSPLTVIEARGGEPVVAGTAFLAPAGRHLIFSKEPSGEVLTRLALHPLDTPHRPSVDVLFHSAAEVFGARVLGVVMTGMGSDGREGAAWIKAKGGRVITEAEESCVVYGMPRSVVEAGLSDGSVPLDSLARTIMGLL
jgi:two-component system, chemotaxis family, protein-glutamate methylesterase/glutaminase